MSTAPARPSPSWPFPRRLAAAAAGVRSRASYGAPTTAEEPHYLVAALSLAHDGDLDVRDELAAQEYRPFHEIRSPHRPAPSQTAA